MGKNPEHTRAVGQLVAAALLWSFAGVLIKGIPWPPLAVAGGRGLIAALFLFATSRGLRFTWSRTQVGAALAYVGCTVLFVVANRMTTAANAILLQYTAPVWVALLGSWFLGERPTRADWWAIIAAFLGMGLFFADELRLASVLGNVVGILSGVCFAGIAILLRKQKDSSVVESIILGNLFAFIIGLPFIAAAPALPPRGLVLLLLLGVVQLGLSYRLYSQAIRHVTALEAVIIPVVEPIMNPVWVLFFVGERPGRLALVGGAIVIGAVTLRAIASIRRAAPLSATA
ncbi:MAG TPA: DMT family transporter [Opitutaceae bacterium]|nr:DMT family transporter [Opitutaceae bacterium]HND61375.1 DMT family transporter [Opitutaceae bacterium]